MKTFPKLYVATAALAVLFILIAWLAGFFTEKLDPALLSPATTAVDDSLVHVVAEKVIDIKESLPATLVARDNTMISSRILARVDKVRVRAGDRVKAGDILVELEQADLQSRVEQAHDQVADISAQQADAERRLDRVAELRARGLSAQADLDAARAGFDSLSAQLSRAMEALAEAEIVLGYSTITAPIAGRIIERLAEPGDTVPPGSPLLSLYDPLSIRVEANVREGLALNLSIGQVISVDVVSLKASMEGTIEEISPAADPGSRSFLVKAALAYNAELMPGMFARFVIPVGTRAEIAIPRSLVTPVGELDMVRMIYNDGTVARRFVRLGRAIGNDVVVTAGLTEGDRLLQDARIGQLTMENDF